MPAARARLNAPALQRSHDAFPGTAGGHREREPLRRVQSYMDMMSQGLRSSLLDEPGLQTLKNHSRG